MTTGPVPADDAVTRWLLDGDPAVRWQVLRDLLDAPADVVSAERSRVATEGLGAELLARQAEDGSWAGVAWNRGWDSTMHVLMLLRDLGLDPDGEPARAALERVRAGVVWPGWGPDGGDNPFLAGEGEPCINGQLAAAGAYFGQDVDGLVERLVGEQLADGGWNCEAENGSARSSFNTTICVLEALLAWERAGGSDPEVPLARRRGEEYLLERRLHRRLSTGEPVVDRKGGTDPRRAAFPTWWHHDVLRGLEHLRAAGDGPTTGWPRRSTWSPERGRDGRWVLEQVHPGAMPVDLGEAEGEPSRWVTLRALRVLRWAGR